MRLVLCDDNRILCEALASVLQARGHRILAIATRRRGRHRGRGHAPSPMRACWTCASRTAAVSTRPGRYGAASRDARSWCFPA